MCGIAAIYSPDHPVDPQAVDRAARCLEHRGPDRHATWISEHGTVGLGHSRLSIIDLTTGDQPIHSEDDRLHLVANGEFYDFEPIQDELEARGHKLRTRSDSEIALHLYEDHGPHCLHRLRGEFAFAIWDERTRVLFAARDRFGVKPLFWARHDGAVYVASEVKALFAAGVPARWDPEALYLGVIVRHPDRTLFQGVHALPPGHYLMASQRGVTVHPYWDIDYPAAHAVTAKDPKELVDGFRKVLDDAVKTRLRADVPVGCYLSGGLDSCAVLGLAQRHRTEPIKAFTLTFDHAQYDESVQAKEMAEFAGAEYIPIPVTQDDLADNFADAVRACETPLINAHGVAKFMLSRAVRDHGYKVVLTGEGSDEMLAGYPPFRVDMLRHNTEGQDPDAVQQILADLEERNQVSRGILLPANEDEARGVFLRDLLGFMPTWLEANLGLMDSMRSVYTDDFLAHHAGFDPARDLLAGLDVEGQLLGREPVHQALYLWAKTSLPGYILTVLGDRMEMANSIEGRVPFLDHHVAEYLRDVPVSMKIKGMTEKYILREATKDVITDTIYNRQKHPFLSPPATLYPDQRLHELLQDTLRGDTLRSMAFIDAGKVERLLDGLADQDMGERMVSDQVLTALMSTVILQEELEIAA
jgi:asparagine synthase (glutamine-hydrolysing)